MRVGYVRVSSVEQNEEHQIVALQQKILRRQNFFQIF